MDEAFSALDPLIRTDMQGVLLDLQKEIKKTIVFITHDLDEAPHWRSHSHSADGEVIQRRRPGRTSLRPADPYVEQFVKEVPAPACLCVLHTTPLDGVTPPARSSISADATLEDALREMVQADVRTAHAPRLARTGWRAFAGFGGVAAVGLGDMRGT